MRLLITGGTGFLGKHVVERVKESSFIQTIWAPSSSELNLEGNYMRIYESVRDFRPDVILHMAARCGGILANKNNPASFLHQNIDMTSNLFHVSRLTLVKKIYTLGSVCSYPKFCPAPFNEDDIWNGYPEETNAPYGIAKRVQLMFSQTYRQEFDIGGAHLIPVNLYGPGDHFDLTNSHVIPALIRKFDDAITNDKPEVKCWGTGTATREFLYAGDAADGIVSAIEKKLDTDQPINLGTGREISIKDLAYLLKDLMGYEGQIVFTGEVSDGQPRRMLDVSRARKLLGWYARTDFKNGLTKTIEWWKKNKDDIIASENHVGDVP